VAILASGGLVVAVLAVVVTLAIVSLGGTNGTAAGPTASAAASSGTGIDMAQVNSLMQKISANPNDTASYQQLGDIYYGAADYTDAATFYDKILAIDPNNLQALLARGAVYYNLGDGANAKTTWDKVVSIDAKNVEAHYDLGFLALNQTPPDYASVQSEWQQVIALDPGSDVATTVQQHLDAMVKASMIPAPSASGAATASGSPAASGGPAASAAASPAPSAQPSAIASPSAAAAGSTAPAPISAACWASASPSPAASSRSRPRAACPSCPRT
jgi:cytochrome c-type biogenesis protein CcmH/NrfG